MTVLLWGKSEGGRSELITVAAISLTISQLKTGYCGPSSVIRGGQECMVLGHSRLKM